MSPTIKEVLGTAAAPAQTRMMGLANIASNANIGRPNMIEALFALRYAFLIQVHSILALASPNAETNGAVAMYAKSIGNAMIL